jgi:hypothetical protein
MRLRFLILGSIASFVPSEEERLQLLEVIEIKQIRFVYFKIVLQRGGLPRLPFVYSSFNQL